MKQFSKFLENIPDDVEVITATDLAGKISAGEFEIAMEYDVAEASNHCTNPSNAVLTFEKTLEKRMLKTFHS